MTVPRAKIITEDFGITTWLIRRHVDGVSDADSLAQPPFPTNCMNWILGHIVWRRNSCLEALGLSPLWEEPVASWYRTNSEPIRSAENARPFTDLVTDVGRFQEILTKALEGIMDAELDRLFTNDRGEKPVIEHIQGFHWHETYHVGQLEVLRAFIDSLGGKPNGEV